MKEEPLKEQTLPAGTILKFMNAIPVVLLEDTKVGCNTDLGERQDLMVGEPRSKEGTGDETVQGLQMVCA